MIGFFIVKDSEFKFFRLYGGQAENRLGSATDANQPESIIS
jgi:hypothetical protein